VVDTAPEFERSLEDLASPEAGQEPRDRLVQALQPHRSHFVDERVGLTEIVVLGVQAVGSAHRLTVGGLASQRVWSRQVRFDLASGD